MEPRIILNIGEGQDYGNLGDALRVLPVSVMGCRKMLVLCGKTYANRLWCVWELFTLLAFTELNVAMERVSPFHDQGRNRQGA